jgi:acyl-CoA thioester hydrolase
MKCSSERSVHSERFSDGHFFRNRIVQGEDIDELGHVNNIVWISYVVQLAVTHARFLGWDLIEKRLPEATWVIHSQKITYHAPAFAGDEVFEETWISLIKGARCIRQTRIHSGSRLLLSAETTWVWIERETGRARRVPAELLAKANVER